MGRVPLRVCAGLLCLELLACGESFPRQSVVDERGERLAPSPGKLTVWLAVAPGACFGCLGRAVTALRELIENRPGEVDLVVLVVGSQEPPWKNQLPRGSRLVKVAPGAFHRAFGGFGLPVVAVWNRKGVLVRVETLPPSGGTLCHLEHYFLEAS